MSFIFEYILAKTDILLDGFFQFLRTDTDISLGHIDTGVLEQGSDQFDIVMIVHIDIRCVAFTKAMRTYPVKTKIRALLPSDASIPHALLLGTASLLKKCYGHKHNHAQTDTLHSAL